MKSMRMLTNKAGISFLFFFLIHDLGFYLTVEATGQMGRERGSGEDGKGRERGKEDAWRVGDGEDLSEAFLCTITGSFKLFLPLQRQVIRLHWIFSSSFSQASSQPQGSVPPRPPATPPSASAHRIGISFSVF